MRSILPIGAAFAILLVAAPAAAQEFEGVSVCRKCHIDQAEGWAQTSHAKAFESLKPNVKAAAKQKGKLDPAKDYTADAACVGCHTTGFGKPGGYSAATPAPELKNFAVVGCESCHGAGSKFRVEHGSAEERWKTGGGETGRDALVNARPELRLQDRVCDLPPELRGLGLVRARIRPSRRSRRRSTPNMPSISTRRRCAPARAPACTSTSS